MNLIVYIISGCLTGLGLFAIVLGLTLHEYTESDLKQTALGVVLIAWGLTFGYYRAISYRGGITTIIGVLLFGVGIYSGIGDFLWRPFVTQKDAFANVFASVFFIVVGGALMWHGHKAHKLNSGK